jgi:serine/threonine protein kinase
VSTRPQPPTPASGTGSYDAVQAIRSLGDYHFLRKLGQGGMGEIFLAKRVGVGGFEKTVVVKTMLESLASSEEFTAMFFDEAHLAARLSHPNIAQIYDFGVIDEQYYLTMEYIPGEDLGSIIGRMYRDELQIPVPVAVRIMIDVCEGLQYAHTLAENGAPLGIVHRDVSPSNVMVGYQGVVKLVDFGIAKAASRVSHTRAGGMKGKLSFVAPELIRGLDIDARADLFSLGITFFSLLTKRHPFQRDSEIAMAHAITDGDAPDPRRLRADLPDELVAILAKALERDRDRRFGSAAEMGAALQAFLGQHAEPTGGREVARFLVDLFGKEAARDKTEVPTLSRLDRGALVGTPTATPRMMMTEGGDLPSPAPRPGSATPRMTTATNDASLGPGLRPWLPAALAALVGVPLLILGVRLLGRGDDDRPVEPAAPVPMVRILAQQLPEDAVPDAGAPPQATAPIVKRPARTPAVAASPPRAPKPPIRLDEKRLKAVVARAQPRLVACFKRHAAELPGETGQVKIDLAVAGSGMVTSAGVHLPGFSSPALARCLEDEALRMEFPAHTDHEIRFAFPLLYRRGGS